MYPLNKAGLLGSALIALLIITSCSDSGTSTTGVTPLSRDAAEGGVINNAVLKKEGDHDHGPQGHEAVGIADPGQGEGLGHQHGEPGEPPQRQGAVTESVISEKSPTSRDEAEAGGPAPKAATKTAPEASSTASTVTTTTDNTPTTQGTPTTQDTPTDTGGVCPTGPKDRIGRCDRPGQEFIELVDDGFGSYTDTFRCNDDCIEIRISSTGECRDGNVLTPSVTLDSGIVTLAGCHTRPCNDGTPPTDNDNDNTWTGTGAFCGPPDFPIGTVWRDCDDNDDTVYPGATEILDGKDNDCDSQVDEVSSVAIGAGGSSSSSSSSNAVNIINNNIIKTHSDKINNNIINDNKNIKIIIELKDDGT